MSIRAVSVKVNGQNPVRVGNVTYDNTVNVKVDNQQDYVVKNVGYGAKRISQLEDVYSLNPTDGNGLVFNAVTGKYVSRSIDSSQATITNMDGGLFELNVRRKF